MMEEEWKDVNGYEGHYKVSNGGNILSLKRNSLVIMSPSSTLEGYLRIKLSKNSISKTISVHRIVCENFIPKIDGKRYINHKNGIKNDNRVENLEWVTQSENVKHGFDVLGRIGSGRKRVGQYTIDGELIKIFSSLAEASKESKVIDNSIGACGNGRRYTAGGFKWKFH
jgi:hypothetical protein